MTRARVAAVLAEGPAAALGDQTRRPELVLVGAGALVEALASEADWLWFLAAGARAEAGALQRLLDAVQPAGEPAAAIVAGMVRDGAGRALEGWLPAPDRRDLAAVIRLLPLRLCPIRHAPLANCLVRREALERHGPLDERRFGPYAAVEWSARVLRAEPGRLCAEAVAVVFSPRRPAVDAAAALRMARTGAWTRGETLSELARLRRPRRGAAPL